MILCAVWPELSYFLVIGYHHAATANKGVLIASETHNILLHIHTHVASHLKVVNAVLFTADVQTSYVEIVLDYFILENPDVVFTAKEQYAIQCPCVDIVTELHQLSVLPISVGFEECGLWKSGKFLQCYC